MDAATGALTTQADFQVVLGPNLWAWDMRFHPSGRFAYLYLRTGNPDPPNFESLLTLNVNPVTGILTDSGASPVANGENARALTVHPNGLYAYRVVTAPVPLVYAYLVDIANGSLTQISGSPYALMGNPQDMAIDSTGQFAYVPNSAGQTISGFRINQSSGALTPLPGSPWSTVPYYPVSLVTTP